MARTPRFSLRTVMLASLATVSALLPMATAAAACAKVHDLLLGEPQPGATRFGLLGANTLTGLIPVIYESLDVVSREMVGFIPAVSRNSSGTRAALNETITIPIAPATSLADNTAAVTAPNTGDQTVGSVSMTISKSKHAPIRWNGEEQRGMLNAGTYGQLLLDQFSQAFRALVNQIEVDLFTTTYKGASRAFGTAGTAPFGTASDLSDFAGVARILDDNGAPIFDRQMVLGGAAVQNLRGKQSLLLKVNEAGSSALLRKGTITDLPVEGFDLHNSAGVVPVTKGTGSGYLINNGAGQAIGDTALTVDTGTGTVLAGDIITLANDTNKYVSGAALASNTITLNAPGLLLANADNAAITVGGNYTPNVAFHRSAVQLITRAPQMPIGPDGKAMEMADDVMQVTDPVSGITFDIAVYRQFMQLVYHVRLAWGYQAIKPAHIATLIG